MALSQSSSAYLEYPTVFPDRPFSVGMWVKFASVGTAQTFFYNGLISSANNYFAIRATSGSAWGLVARGGGTENSVTGGTVTAGQWAYVVARFITATNDRASILRHDGTVTALQRTTSRTPAGMNAISLGALIASNVQTERFGGGTAEYWLASGDIQPDGLALSNDLLRQLAFYGPLSVPHIAGGLITFKRFFQSQFVGTSSTAGQKLDDVWFGKYGPYQAGQSSGSLPADHPPLAPGYVTPSAYAAMTIA